MDLSISLIYFWLVIVGLLSLAAVAFAWRMRPARVSRLAVAAVTAPALLVLALFYSLAIHMHQSLGGWPESIGERGFPPALVTHAFVASTCFSALLLTNLFLWPLAYLSCALVERTRLWLFYLGVYALASWIGFGLMMIAPARFLSWWWD
jgi:hypothetical protein